MNLNLSKFKKIKEDEKSAVLEHPAGHQITIAKNSLSDQMQKEVSALPLCNGGVVQKFANGGQASADDISNLTADNEDQGGYSSLGAKEEALKADQDSQPVFPDAKPASDAPSAEAPDSTIDKEEDSPSADDVYNARVAAEAQSMRQQNYAHEDESVIEKRAQQKVLDQMSAEKDQSDQEKAAAEQQSQEQSQAAEKQKAANQQTVTDYAMDHFNHDVQYVKSQNDQRAKLGLQPLPLPVPPPIVAQQMAANNSAPQAPAPSNVPVQPSAPESAGPEIASPSGASAFNASIPSLEGETPMDLINKGYQGQMQGLTQEAQARGLQGQKEAQAYQEAIQQQQANQDDFKQKTQDFMSHQQKFMEDYQAGHIDPNHLVNSMSTGQKLATGIGILLSGFGGASGQSNMAMDYLNKQIDNDIASQKQDIDTKHNLLAANMDYYRNIMTATDMTRINLQGILADKIAKAGAESQDPLARAIALQKSGELQQKIATEIPMIAMKQQAFDYMNQAASGSGSATDPARQIMMMQKTGMMDPETAKTAMKNLGDLKEQQSTLQQYQNDFDDINKMIGRGILSPNRRNAAIKLLAGRIEKISEGRYNAEAAQNTAKSMFPEISDFSDSTVRFKRAQGINFIQSLMEPNKQTLQAYGIKTPEAGAYDSAGNRRFKEQAPVVR